MVVALERGSRSQESVVALLQEVVGEPIVASRPSQIQPNRTRGLFVEDPKFFFGHLERSLGVFEGSRAFHVRERKLTHTVPHASGLFGFGTRPRRVETT